MSSLGGCDGLERTELRVSTLVGYGGLESTDFQHFLPWDGVAVLKVLNFNSFYFCR